MNETNKITLIVTKEEAGIRLDQFLFLHKAAISRSKASLIIRNKECLVNSKFEKAHYLVEENDEVSFLPYLEKESQLVPEEVPFEVVYEDDYLLVINKPRGLIVHPGNGHKDKTLVNGLLYRKTKLADTNDYIRPGIVHRIDKDTSGLLVVAKTSQAMLGLQEQLSSHSMHREYKALALGIINENEGKIIAPIGRDKANRIKMCVDLKNGKEAITNFKVIERFKKSNVTYIDCKLETGRTHQIRVHFDYIGHPLLGDPIYGKGNRTLINDGQLLHAYRLSFFHPILNKQMCFEVGLPSYFQDVLNKLN